MARKRPRDRVIRVRLEGGSGAWIETDMHGLLKFALALITEDNRWEERRDIQERKRELRKSMGFRQLRDVL